MVDTCCLKPKCRSELFKTLFSLISKTQSNTLPIILLKVIALQLSEQHNSFLLPLGMGIIVPLIMLSGLTPCTIIQLKTILSKTVSKYGPLMMLSELRPSSPSDLPSFNLFNLISRHHQHLTYNVYIFRESTIDLMTDSFHFLLIMRNNII